MRNPIFSSSKDAQARLEMDQNQYSLPLEVKRIGKHRTIPFVVLNASIFLLGQKQREREVGNLVRGTLRIDLP